MKVRPLNRLFFQAYSIIAVVLLLLVLIGISTYQNLDHQRETALKFTHRQGLTMIHAFESGARAALSMPMHEEYAIDTLVREAGKGEDIAYLYMIDSQGRVVHHSTPSLEGMISDWLPRVNDDQPVRNRIRPLPDGSLVYELARRFAPLPSKSISSRPKGMMKHQPPVALSRLHQDTVMILGLKMTAFQEARKADIQHAFIMAAIVIALGSGAIFFIFVIQNYALINRTLRQTQDYTRLVVASMPNGLLSIDLQGEVVSHNHLALELLDIDESNTRGMNLKTILDLEQIGIQKTLSRCLPVLEHEIDYKKETSGEKIPLALSATPILDNNRNCTGAVILIRDLREIRQLKERVYRSEKLAAIGKLSAGVAHEIRNPLSSIKGFAQHLRHVQTGHPRQEEYADIIVKEVDRIDRVVNDLLTFSRPMEPEKAPTDIEKLIEHTIHLIQNEADSKQLVIHQRISQGLDEIALDANQMTQVLLNLMLNAMQEVSEGGSIEVGAEMDEVGSRLVLWVEDDGPGIPIDPMEKIFDPFFTTREKGTGLGLAIVHKIVENHGGNVRINSPLSGRDMGCRFTITLPIIEAIA